MHRLFARHTHLYPGARLSAPEGPGGPVELEFTDGTVVGARLDRTRLEVAAYETAAGTAIPPRQWAVERRDDGLRVTRRL